MIWLMGWKEEKSPQTAATSAVHFSQAKSVKQLWHLLLASRRWTCVSAPQMPEQRFIESNGFFFPVQYSLKISILFSTLKRQQNLGTFSCEAGVGLLPCKDINMPLHILVRNGEMEASDSFCFVCFFLIKAGVRDFYRSVNVHHIQALAQVGNWNSKLFSTRLMYSG